MSTGCWTRCAHRHGQVHRMHPPSCCPTLSVDHTPPSRPPPCAGGEERGAAPNAAPPGVPTGLPPPRAPVPQPVGHARDSRLRLRPRPGGLLGVQGGGRDACEGIRASGEGGCRPRGAYRALATITACYLPASSNTTASSQNDSRLLAPCASRRRLRGKSTSSSPPRWPSRIWTRPSRCSSQPRRSTMRWRWESTTGCRGRWPRCGMHLRERMCVG